MPEYTGKISAKSPDGRSAFIRLEPPVAGKTFAVVSTDTIGRVTLRNGKGFKIDQPVKGEAIVGIEALRAVTVEKA